MDGLECPPPSGRSKVVGICRRSGRAQARQSRSGDPQRNHDRFRRISQRLSFNSLTPSVSSTPTPGSTRRRKTVSRGKTQVSPHQVAIGTDHFTSRMLTPTDWSLFFSAHIFSFQEGTEKITIGSRVDMVLGGHSSGETLRGKSSPLGLQSS